MLQLRRGELYGAVAMAQRGVEVCRAREIRNLVPFMSGQLGYASALLGRVADGIGLLLEAAESAAQMRATWHHAAVVAWLGEAMLLAGRSDDAIRQGRLALDLSRARGERGHEAYALRLLGEIGARNKQVEVEEAERDYRDALVLAEELEMRPLQAHCHVGIGKLYRAVGQPERARVELSTAVTMLREMGMEFWLPEAETALAGLA
jgi:tetratricopeptide (TPR) repeat protein